MLPALENVSAETLLTLAAYFDSQAAFLKSKADEIMGRQRDAQEAQNRRAKRKAELLELGRLIAETSAVAAISAGFPPDYIAAAKRVYQTEIKDKAMTARNLEIWKAVNRGVAASELAARFNMTPRRVRMIAQDFSHSLSQTAFDRSTLSRVSSVSRSLVKIG